MSEKDSWWVRDVKDDGGGGGGQGGGAKALIHRLWIVWQTSCPVTGSKANSLSCSFLSL